MENRLARRKDWTEFDAIWAFYFSKEDVKLTEHEEKVRQRWFFAWSQLLELSTHSEVATALNKQFEISERQAYDDVKNSIRLFNDPKKVTKEMKRTIAEHWIIKGLKKASEAKDDEMYDKMIGKYIKIHRLDEPDEEGKHERSPVIINLNAEVATLEKQKQELRDRAAKIEATDTEFEDVTP